jgi:hypothetical protein
VSVPRLSAFRGLVIFMPANDHDPPHFHVTYSGDRGRIAIATGAVLPGSTLPRRALRLVERWRRLHADELIAAWASVRDGQQPGTIEPLR